MAEITMVAAITMALARAMQDDDRVVVFGEDVAKNGGVFRATEGLLDRFGENRVMDTPLAETVIAGMSIGMAAQGLRPVAEFQFMGFMYPALDQVINHASRLRNRTRGRLVVSARLPRADGRRHPRARASFGKHRDVVRAYSGSARRHSVVARRAPTVCCSRPSPIPIR